MAHWRVSVWKKHHVSTQYKWLILNVNWARGNTYDGHPCRNLYHIWTFKRMWCQMFKYAEKYQKALLKYWKPKVVIIERCRQQCNQWLRSLHHNYSRFSSAGPWFNIKMSSYQYRKFHCGDKTILRPSYLHNWISYTGKTTSLYWIGALVLNRRSIPPCLRARTGEECTHL